MSMTDPWETLSSTWREEPAPETDLRDVVRARTRRATLRLWASVAVEVAIVTMVLALTVVTLEEGLTPYRTLLLAAVWATTIAALIFTVRNRRGTWRVSGDSTRDFLALAERRARGKLRTARFALWLLAAQLPVHLLLLGWRVSRWSDPGGLAAELLTLAVVFGSYALWSLWFRRRALAELSWVTELRDVLAEESEPPL